MIKNAFFIIEDGPQVWAIRDVNEDQVEWLRKLAHILNARVTHSAASPTSGVHYGVLGFKRFRELMRDAGYDDAIKRADDRYRARAC